MNKNRLSYDAVRPAGRAEVLKIGDTELSLIWCPPGTFAMGSDDPSDSDALLHEVTLNDGFWMSVTAVTQHEWQEVMGARYRAPEGGSGELPVESPSWDRAVELCKALTLRLRSDGSIASGQFCSLPTEAQWEYACRAGTTTPWYFGASEAELTRHAWFDDNSDGELHAVALKLPNPWGLYDLYGNVAEWCLDDYAEYQAGSDPIGELDGELKVLRGGSYADAAGRCRSAARGSLIRGNPFSEETGVRIVINPVGAWRDRRSPIAEMLL
jgi:formylglycine-generating enzyme required for sulfatase activity